MKNKRNQVLLIEDDKVDQMAFQRFLREMELPYDLTIADSVAEAKSILDSNKFDIVISDHFLGDGTAFEIFNLGLDTPIIMMTGSGDQEIAVKAMRSGAYDYLIKDSENNHLKVLASTVENAISRKKIEEELQLMQFSIDNTSDSVFWITPTGQLLYANLATCQTLGYTRDELLSMNWNQIAENLKPNSTVEFVENLKKKGSVRLELNHRRKDDSVFPVDIMANYKIVNDKDYIFIFARDITENKRAQEALEESEEKYRDLFENASDLIQSVNAEGKFLYVNNKWLNCLGYSKTETEELRLKNILREDQIPHCMQLFDNVCAGQTLDKIETIFIAKNGREIFVEGAVNARFKDGKFVATRAIFHDVTERKLMEEQIKRYTEHLEDEVKQRTTELIQSEKMASLGELVAGVAHEINNPLAFIKTNTEFLEENLLDLNEIGNGKGQSMIEEMKKLININHEGIKRIATITKTLKRFVKPNDDGRSPSNINQGLKDTLIIVHNHLKHRIDVHEELGNIPDIICNLGQINQVFMNLIMNASQAMEEGDIWLKTWIDKNDVYIQIRDNGNGIPEDKINKIFDPFFTTKAEGTGLGLSLVYKIIQSHGGEIKVESNVGTGTTMRIRLPIEV